MQNHTRTCSIDPENNEESLNEEANSCTLPSCSWKDHQSKSIQAQKLIATLPQRADTSRAAFSLSFDFKISDQDRSGYHQVLVGKFGIMIIDFES